MSSTPTNWKPANREDYKGNAAALKVIDVADKLGKGTPTNEEVRYWSKRGTADYESLLRGDITVKTEGGRKYRVYNEAALERNGGKLGTGLNKNGEILVVPAGSAVSSSRYAGSTQGDYSYYVPVGAKRSGIGQKVFGKNALGKVTDRAFGWAGSTMPLVGGTVAALGGEEGYSRYQGVTRKAFGDRGLRFAEQVGAPVTSVAAGVADVVMFGGAPVFSSLNQAAQAMAGFSTGREGAIKDAMRNTTVGWASYWAMRGLDTLQTKGMLGVAGGRAYETVVRPAAQIAVGTGAGVARGQKASDAFLSSSVGVAASSAGLGPYAQAGIRAGVLAASPTVRDAWSGGNRMASVTYLAGEAVLGYAGAGGFSTRASLVRRDNDLETQPIRASQARDNDLETRPVRAATGKR
jgi:hypothetical protein